MIREEDRTALAAGLAALLATLVTEPLLRPGWFGITFVAIAGVTAVGLIGRRMTGMWAWVVVAQLFALFAVLTLWAGGVPGPGGVELLGDLVRQGLEVTRLQSAPVEAAPGVVLLCAGGFGLVALAMDVISGPLRSPALAGLPMLAAYALAIGLVPDGVSWLRFGAPAAGYLLMLAVGSGRTRRAWGRPLRDPVSGSADTEGPGPVLGRDGRRVGAAALALALVVPPLLPQLGAGFLLDGRGAGGDGDGNRVSVLNPILDMRENLTSQSDFTLFRYSTSDSSPPPIRVVADEVFDGSTWSPRRTTLRSDRRVQDGLSDPPGLDRNVTDTRQVQMEIQVNGLKQSYLPAPYPATRVQTEGNWLYDPETLNMYGVRTDTEDRTFRVDYLDVLPSADGLAQSPNAPITMPGVYTEVPEDLPAIVRDTAQAVAGDETDAYAQAAALQAWFRDGGGFQYSTVAPPVGDNDSGQDSIAAFLQTKRGYCVHFASAMAVMARTLGIPARVAVGFLPGTEIREGVWEVTAQDAHAWPELYFDNAGWIRFEPTVGFRTGDAPAYTVPRAAEDDGAGSTASASAGASASASASVTDRAPDAADAAADDADAGSGGTDVPWTALLVVLVLLVLLAAPVSSEVLLRRRRYARAAADPARLAESAWLDLRERLLDLGVTVSPSATPRQTQARLAEDHHLGGSERAALGRLVKDLEAALYSVPTPEDDPRTVPATSADVSTVVSGVASTRRRPQRLRARWFPTTGLRMLLGLAGRADRAADGAAESLRERIHH